jgi:glucose/arabinose dehydrogenase
MTGTAEVLSSGIMGERPHCGADHDRCDRARGSSRDDRDRARGIVIRRILVQLSVLSFVAVCGWAASAQSVSVERVVSGLTQPLFLTAPPGDFDRAFIVQQNGSILVLDLATNQVGATPFLTVSGLPNLGEQGLLGMAFHPDYATNGFFYVSYTDPNTRIVRYQVSAGNPDVANPASAAPILEITQPQVNHNGGWLGFGPDDFLYVAVGDGGNGNDSGAGHTPGIGNAQDLTNLLGKILRIDVDGDDFPVDPNTNYAIPASNPFVGVAGADEIWVYGLRNPWRPSFDRVTGDLYIADVGQQACEEVSLQLGSSMGGENYGWRLREGVIETPGVGDAKPAGAIDPLFDYPHSGATCSNVPAGYSGSSITGGYVYRGPIAALQGRYFLADFFTARLWSLVWDGTDPSLHDGTNYLDLTDHSLDPDFDPDEGTIGQVSSFGEDAAGNLYVMDLGGEVFRIPEPGAFAQSITALLVVLAAAILRGHLRSDS